LGDVVSAHQFRRIGKFELHELIGEGAMGVVWKAYDPVLRRYIALKLLSTRFGKRPAMRERFLREARAAGVLQHPNIVTVYDAGEDGGQLFIAMEMVEGRDLSDIIASTEPLPLERKLDIVIEVLEGLHYAHQRGVIHRDVKPLNVRIAPDGRAKIMDFGIARLQSGDVEGSAAIVGTPTYMAPEQITNGPVTPATDVFAVGCLLYELLSYRKPFEGETVHGVLYQVLTTDPRPLRTMAPSIPASLERVVMKAINKVPEDRYGTAEQMLQMLNGIRAALAGAASDTTERLNPRWSPIPAPLLKLVTHTPMRWRAVVLSALVLVVGVLAYGPTPVEPVRAVTPTLDPGTGAAELPGLAVPTVSGLPVPASLNPALSALRDSALATRERAVAAGAIKNRMRAALLGESLLETADRLAASGDVASAAPGWRESAAQFQLARREAVQVRDSVAALIQRATPVVQALGMRPQAAAAAASLARAESLLTSNDFDLARIAAQNAEQIGLAAGVAPPSPQPEDARAAVAVLLRDLERAVRSRNVANLRPLYPTISDTESSGWKLFFERARDLQATYQLEQFVEGQSPPVAIVRAHYRFTELPAGTLQEVFPKLRMSLRRYPAGWRITGVTVLRSSQ
jgi:serine/threonine protein kinase